MRPMLTAVVLAAVLLTAAFLFVAPISGRGAGALPSGASGLRTAATPTYFVTGQVTTNPVLPGYHDNLLYFVENNTNHAPFQQLSSLTITGTYYNTALKQLVFPGTPATLSPSTPISSWAFTVPANATTDPFDSPVLTVWANASSLSMTTSNSFTVWVGTLGFSFNDVCSTTFNCGSLTTGVPAYVETSVRISGDFGFLTGPAAGEAVTFTYYSTGSSPVTVPGVPGSLTTDSNGYAAETFTPNSTIFNVPGPNRVWIHVTDSVNSSLHVDDNATWNLYNPAGTADYAFWLSAPQYYSGAQVTAYWQWRGTNATVGTITLTNYVVTDASSHTILANALIGSTAASGSFQFTLASSYYGTIDVVAFAHNTSDYWTLGASANVYQGLFAAVPSELYYNPGDVITVSITEQGPGFSGAAVNAVVQAGDSGQTLFNGAVSGGSFQFTIPAVAPAGSYIVNAWAYSSTQGLLATFGGYIYEASGYDFWAGIASASSYADGSFMPGQTVQLGYKVTPYGTSTAPLAVELELFPGDCSVTRCFADTPPVKLWASVGASGSVAFTLPNSLPNGVQTFNVVALFAGTVESDPVSVTINSAPSVLNYELGAGSGLTVGWLILLILILVVAFVIIMSRRRGGSARMVMSPTPSTSTPAAEWKEPASSSSGTSGSSSSSPTPPPGAQ